MAISYPASPSLGDVFVDGNGKNWNFDGSGWLGRPTPKVFCVTGTLGNFTNIDSDTMSGSLRLAVDGTNYDRTVLPKIYLYGTNADTLTRVQKYTQPDHTSVGPNAQDDANWPTTGAKYNYAVAAYYDPAVTGTDIRILEGRNNLGNQYWRYFRNTYADGFQCPIYPATTRIYKVVTAQNDAEGASSVIGICDNVTGGWYKIQKYVVYETEFGGQNDDGLFDRVSNHNGIVKDGSNLTQGWDDISDKVEIKVVKNLVYVIPRKTVDQSIADGATLTALTSNLTVTALN